MKLLEPAGYQALHGLLGEQEHDLAVVAVARGDATGQVWADDPIAPRLALVSPHWGRLYLRGTADTPQARSNLRELLLAEILPAGRAAGFRAYTIAYPPDWHADLPAIIEGPGMEQADRQFYRWEGPAPEPTLPPAGFALLPADAALLADGGVSNLQALREEMISERASVEDFMARSFGIAAVHIRRPAGGELAGWCLSEYNAGDRCEVGIATLEPFQRRGLAKAMGQAFLRMAYSKGIREVGWHCWKQNIPSAATARALGFRHIADYPVYVGWYEEAGAAA